MAATDGTDRSAFGMMPCGRARLALALGVGAALMIVAPPLAWSQSSGQASIDALHRALRLSSTQEDAWRTYRAQGASATAAQERRQAASQMFPNLHAPQRMDLVEAEMKQELLDLQQQSQALKAFYATLNHDQQATFDAQTLPSQDSQQQSGQ